MPKQLVIYLFLTFAVSLTLQENKVTKIEEDSSVTDEQKLKCDACKIISNRFGLSFEKAEKESKQKPLIEDEYIEAAESTCDEEWSGYGITYVDNVQRLAGPGSEVEINEEVEFDQIWDRRLQDFCDELLSEAPDEKTLYHTWSSSASSLENYLCQGEGIFNACTDEEFGPWPGDEYEDYDEMDFDYVHDEF